MIHRVASACLFAALAMAAPAAAQSVDAEAGQVISLTPRQRAELLDSSTEASVNAARAGLGRNGGGDRAIHGEVGAMIGTNGARGVFGTAAIPLGDNAGAVISFEDSRYGRIRGR